MKKVFLSLVGLSLSLTLLFTIACSANSDEKAGLSTKPENAVIVDHSLTCYGPISSQKITFQLITAAAEPRTAPATLFSETQSVSLDCKSYSQEHLGMKEIWRCADEPVRDVMNIVSVYHLNTDQKIAVIEQSPLFPQVTLECE